MKFSEIVAQARTLLQRTGKVTYRVLKREFDLDEESLEDLKEQLIEAEEVAVDKDGKMLMWVGIDAKGETAHGDKGAKGGKTEAENWQDGESAFLPQSPAPHTQPPIAYTPAHLADRIRAVAVIDGERKTITALFADLKGSTALIEGLDPEDARAIIDPALQLMMDAVHRYDGYVAQALGDGIFALFGAPIAHEDHPRRALYAALRMQEEMRTYGDQVRLKHGVPLPMRVGINTGEVVVRSIRKDDLHTDYVPVGHSTNLAARMEQLANPGSIVISAYTRKLTEGYFELKDLGATQIKGVEEPLHVYEVLGAGPLRTRLQVSARRGFTRFVGRQSELDQLQRVLEQAKAGHGQIVGVMGEPGLGKSRLFHEFKQLAQGSSLVLEACGISYGQTSPYLPIIGLLRTYFQLGPTDDEQTRKEKITGTVLTLDRSLEDTLPYFFSLLSIDDPDSSLHQMDAQIRRQRAFAALKKLFLRESLNQPLILIFEDLHWIDTETQGFLDTLSESVASAPVLLLVNYRPEYRHEWGGKTYYTQLRLIPLGQAEASELFAFLLGTDGSLTALKALILEKTEGTPFFMEEVVQTLVEEGALMGERGHYHLETTPTELHISPTVQGVLAARIDRLTAEEKALLQQLSVIGRQFPMSLVKQVVPQSEADLYRLLSSLQAKEFLYEQPAFPELEYLFKHALTQEIAYGTVLQEPRKVLHERTGHAMEALYGNRLEEHYSELAYHYRRSENRQKATEYLALAGQQAVQRSAHAEAIALLTSALELLHTLPHSDQHAQQELGLQDSLAVSLIATKGWGSPQAQGALSRARELCHEVEDNAQLFPILWKLWGGYFSQAASQTESELAEQLFVLAQSRQDPLFLTQAHYALGCSFLSRGDMVRARAHMDQAIGLYDTRNHRTCTHLFGQDPGVTSLAFGAYPLWYLGYPDHALEQSHEALRLAQELAHPFSQAFALSDEVLLRMLRREAQPVRELAEAAMGYASEHGFTQQLAGTTVGYGWALAEQGHAEEGLTQLRQSFRVLLDTGAEIMRPRLSAALAGTYWKLGHIEEGLRVLREALAGAQQTGVHEHDAELYRLTGELTLQAPGSTPNINEAEACYHTALGIARHQQAKSLELRTATSLARLWRQQGKQSEAHDLLAPVYNWFTEGFDTKDLKDAKTLLDELS